MVAAFLGQEAGASAAALRGRPPFRFPLGGERGARGRGGLFPAVVDNFGPSAQIRSLYLYLPADVTNCTPI